MQFIRCNACPAFGQCTEAERCLNVEVVACNSKAMTSFVPLVLDKSQAPPTQHIKEPETFSAPKTGTSTSRIFDLCSRLWKEQGCTEEKGKLDEIRRCAVEKLVAEGLNINTVKTQSFRWYQNRKQLVI